MTSTSVPPTSIVSRQLRVRYQNPQNGEETTKTILFSSSNLHVLEHILYQSFNIPRSQGIMFSLEDGSIIVYPISTIHLYDDIIGANKNPNERDGNNSIVNGRFQSLSCELQVFPLIQEVQPPHVTSVIPTISVPVVSKSSSCCTPQVESLVPAVEQTKPTNEKKCSTELDDDTPCCCSGKVTDEARDISFKDKVSSNVGAMNQNRSSKKASTAVHATNKETLSNTIEKDTEVDDDEEPKDNRKKNRGLDHRNSYLKEEKLIIMLLRDTGRSADEISLYTGVSKSNIEKWCGDRVREQLLTKYLSSPPNAQALQDCFLQEKENETIKKPAKRGPKALDCVGIHFDTRYEEKVKRIVNFLKEKLSQVIAREGTQDSGDDIISINLEKTSELLPFSLSLSLSMSSNTGSIGVRDNRDFSVIDDIETISEQNSLIVPATVIASTTDSIVPGKKRGRKSGGGSCCGGGKQPRLDIEDCSPNSVGSPLCEGLDPENTVASILAYDMCRLPSSGSDAAIPVVDDTEPSHEISGCCGNRNVTAATDDSNDGDEEVCCCDKVAEKVLCEDGTSSSEMLGKAAAKCGHRGEYGQCPCQCLCCFYVFS